MAHADVFASAKMVKKSDIQGGKYLKKKKFSKFLKKIEQCMKYDRMLEENKRGIVKTLPKKMFSSVRIQREKVHSSFEYGVTEDWLGPPLLQPLLRVRSCWLSFDANRRKRTHDEKRR